MLKREDKLAIYMEGELVGDFAKMCHGILRYSPNEVVAIIDSAHAGQDVRRVVDTPRSAPIVASVDEAAALGANVFVLGIAAVGGRIPESWYAAIDEAVITHKMSVLNGLHDRLAPRYPKLLHKASDDSNTITLQHPTDEPWIWDIRIEPEGLNTGTGAAAKLTNKRVLLIGTDMAIGKMTAGLEIYKSALEKGIQAEFVATGQIGITITGRGVPLDAVRVDYASGAIEREVMAVADAELVLVEGQGALIHPGSTANLPLIRGSCPTHLILCHKAGQTHLRRMSDIKIPPLKDYIHLYEDLAEACGTFPRPRTASVALNTAGFSPEEAARHISDIETATGLPTDDPVRNGADKLLATLTG